MALHCNSQVCEDEKDTHRACSLSDKEMLGVPVI